MADERQKTVSKWTVAGVIVVTLAVLTMVAGLYFAIGQARAIAYLRNRDALRQETEELRAAARSHITQVATEALTAVAEHLHAVRKGDPFGRRRDPAWLAHFFAWDRTEFHRWYAKGQDPMDETDRDRLDALARRRMRSQLINAGPNRTEPMFRFLRGSIEGQPVALASLVVPDERLGSIITGGYVDLTRLKSDYLDDHFASAEHVAVNVRSSGRRHGHSIPLIRWMPTVRIQLRPEFIAAQRTRVNLQITAYVIVTIVVVVSLLVMMWILVRRVRREVELSRLKSSFVGDVSHELKTPLALIRMFAETLSEGRVRTEEKKHEYYEIISRESTRLTHLIDNILDFSRIDAGKKEYDMKQIDVGQIVRDTYDAYRFDLDHHGFSHCLTVDEGLSEIHADPDAVAQAVVNLISNAMKYSHDEKSLDIEVVPETRRGKHGVLISVKDRGIGIQPEDRAHLFDGFFRATDDRVRSQRGAGLGLALVKHIVDAHGGSIDVESRLVKGTTFRLFLPESK